MSTVNSQVNDSVNNVTATVVGNAPAQSFGMLDTVMAETVGMLMQNAVNAQQNAQMIGNASVTATCAKMLQVLPATAPEIKPQPSPSPTGSPGGIAQDIQAAESALGQLGKDLKEGEGQAKEAKGILQQLANAVKGMGSPPDAS